MIAPGLTESWYSYPSLLALLRSYRIVEDLDGLVIEVGSWEGCSTCLLANAAYPATVHAVDTWAGSPLDGSAALARARDVKRQFETNVAAWTLGNVAAHRMGWRDYFAPLSQPVRFLHIDAEHSYQEVRDNIEAAAPLMVKGGIVCGDDATHAPVLGAARDALGNVEIDAETLWWWQKL